jgi:lysozyme
MKTPRGLGPRGLDLITSYEDCVLEAYTNPGDMCTIGFGHTKTAKMGMVITKERAYELLMLDVADAEADVKNLVTAPLSNSMYDALVSWTFNLGGKRLSQSTMLRTLNKAGTLRGAPRVRGYLKAAHQMTDWYQTPGFELGLFRRRLAEAALFVEDPLP